VESPKLVMPPASNSRFQTTSWSLVLAAAGQPTEASRTALARLCGIYWHPIYAFIRRNGHSRDQARDLTQSFFALLIEKHYLTNADQRQGRFRSFLLTAVKGFLANEWDRSHALKRGGFQIPVSIDQVDAEVRRAPEAVEQRTPESLYEYGWAISLLEQAMKRLRADFARMGKSDYFEKIAPLLSGATEEASYKARDVELGISAGALRQSVHRARRKYRDLLRAEVAETVSTPEEVDKELQFLLSTLSG
jgi:DNA-directed RNA polymerase specialized sigma24 family protein